MCILESLFLMTQLICEPTRITTTSSLLDIILTNVPNLLNIRRLAEIVPQVTSVAFGFRQCSYVITKSATLTLYCGSCV